MSDENIKQEENSEDDKIKGKKSAQGGSQPKADPLSASGMKPSAGAKIFGGKSFFGKACKDCEKHKNESEEYKAGWQRALADYKNLQNEIIMRRSEWAQMSETQILEEFIPVYENFKKAFLHHPEVAPDNEEHKAFKNWIDGIGFIMKQFNDILKAHGVEEIKTVGEKFDPKFHEAMSALAPESDDSVQGKNQESGIIVKELEGGYKVGNKVIKAAKVIVSK